MLKNNLKNIILLDCPNYQRNMKIILNNKNVKLHMMIRLQIYN